MPVRVLSESRVVYPRVCGGTLRITPELHVDNGLSPRVRGNLEKGAGRDEVAQVYPRVCGGTV